MLFTACFTTVGCHREPPKTQYRAFYYWKTTFELKPAETVWLKEQKVTKLYVRYFDVDWDAARQEAQPVAPLIFRSAFPANLEIIPAVYLTNKTLQQMPANLIPRLAGKIFNQVEQLHKAGKAPELQEVQLDCDWSESTRIKYFLLVENLKSRLQSNGVKLSVTIRLHQVKYASRTGIPPADRGMLMFYNMGKISAKPGTNSIYEPEIAAKYLQNFKTYSLPLDVALPAFSWAIHMRKGKPNGLLNNLDASDLTAEENYKPLGKNLFRVQKPLFLQGRYLFPGDVVKVETIGPEQTKAAARQIAPFLKEDTLTAALFHLDEKNLQPYQPHDLEEIYNSLL